MVKCTSQMQKKSGKWKKKGIKNGCYKWKTTSKVIKLSTVFLIILY